VGFGLFLLGIIPGFSHNVHFLLKTVINVSLLLSHGAIP